MIGDFNVDFAQNNNPVKKMKRAMEARTLKQIITGATRITHNTSSMIDLAFTDMSFIQDKGVANANISAHLPIYVIKKKCREHREYVEIMGRALRTLIWINLRKT